MKGGDLNAPLSHFNNQFKQVYLAFMEKPKTMLEVSIETGILRANICRYCSNLRKSGRLFEVKRTKCPISNHWAIQLTTNKEFAPPTNQLNLFDND